MSALGTTPETETLLTQGGPTVEYSVATLESIRLLAVNGFSAFAHGGLEIGGVLYGLREEGRVIVVSSAELACEHAFGPAFILSEGDLEALSTLLEPPEGLETVGWYRVHTRSGLELDDHDRKLFDSFPSGVACTALIVKPTIWGPANAAFYVREPDGQIIPPQPCEFLLEPPKRKATPHPIPIDQKRSNTDLGDIDSLPVPQREPRWENDQDAGPPPVVTTQEAAAPETKRRPKWGRLSWVLGLVAACALVGVAFWPRPQRKLELAAHAIAPGQVRIEWNHNSLPVLQARSATLLIDDGTRSDSIPLEFDQLRSTSITYSQQSDHIFIRLHVVARDASSPPVDEAIQFVGQPEPQSAPAGDLAAPAAPVRSAAKKEPATSPAPLPKAPAVRVDEVRPPSKIDIARKNEAPPTRQPVVSRFQAPRLLPAATSPASPLPVPPAFSSRPTPSSVPDFMSSAAPVRPVAPPAAIVSSPVPAPVLPPSAPAYNGPPSGRLIWTGVLGKRGVLDIDGSHVDVGSLAGALPGVAVTVRAAPAEFGRDGLMVFTEDSRKAGEREPATRSTGWNAVHFQVDAERARGLVVLESPSRANDFKRLVLRNDLRNCSVIVIDWSVRP